MAVLPFSIKLSYAGTPAGTITYNAGTDTITVIGANSTHPAEFLDLYNADIAGGWGQITMQGSNQFNVACKIYIGNGTTAGTTYFNDTGRQIWLDNPISAAYTNAIEISSYSFLTLGTLLSSTAKSTKDGTSIIANSSYQGRFIVIRGHSGAYMYGCQFSFVGSGSMFDLRPFAANATVKAYNCIFGTKTGISSQDSGSICDLYRCTFSNCYVPLDSVSGTINDIRVENSTDAVILRTNYNQTLRNLIVRGSTANSVWSYQQSTDKFFIDCDFDVWTFAWTSYTSGLVYRQNSFDLFVLNGALTDFVEDANVTLTHDGTVFGSWLTNSTGQIDTETLTYGFYNQTGGNTMYGGTPWTLTITHPDWETYTSAFYPYSEIDWSISMQDTSTSNNNMLLVGLLVGSLAFLGLVVIRRKT